MRALRRYGHFRNASGDMPVRYIAYSQPGVASIIVQGKPADLPITVGQSVVYQNGATSISGNIKGTQYDNMSNETHVLMNYVGAAIEGMNGGILTIGSVATPDSFAVTAQAPIVWGPTDVSADGAMVIPKGYTALLDVNGNTRLLANTLDPASLLVQDAIAAGTIITPDSPFAPPSPAGSNVIVSDTKGFGWGDEAVPQADVKSQGAGMIVPDTQGLTQPLSTAKTINASSIALVLILGGVAIFGLSKLK
jgi:hypothetical protein